MQENIKFQRYGMRSGFATALGLSAQLLFLLVLLLSGTSASLVFLVITSIGAKLLGENFFWKNWAKDVSELKNGNVQLNYEMIAHPNVWIPLFTISLDCIADAVLIVFALENSMPPVLTFFILLICQAIASPIQGFCSDQWSQKNSLLFSLGIAIFCLAIMNKVSPDWIILLLALKGTLGNSTAIARAAMAEGFIHQVEKKAV